MIKHTRGNRLVLDYQLEMDGDALGEGENPALNDITLGQWMMKRRHDDLNDDAAVSVTYNPMFPTNPNFQLNIPATAWVRIIIDSDMLQDVEAGRYYFALQLEWGAKNKQEFQWGDGVIEICKDVIQ